MTKPFVVKTSAQSLISPSDAFMFTSSDRPMHYLSNEHVTYSDAALVVAAYQGNLAQVKCEVVKEKTNVKCLEAALIVAAEKGHYDIVSFLLEGGVNSNLRNRADQPLLYRAAFLGYANIVSSLLKAGADPLVKVQMDNGCFPSSYYSPSYAVTIAIECNHFEVYTVMMTHMYTNKQLDWSLVTTIIYLLMKYKYPNRRSGISLEIPNEIRRILKSDLEIDSNNGLSVYVLDNAITNNFLDIAQTVLEKGVMIKNILG
jgi:ankyrin repeat protein